MENLAKFQLKKALTLDEQFARNFSKKDWEYLEKVFVIFEIALKDSKGNVNKLRDLFFDKIKDSFGKQK